MGIFDNVIFDEFTLLEGQQAEEYKERKAKEKIYNDYVDDYKACRSHGHFSNIKRDPTDKEVNDYFDSIDKGNKAVDERYYRYKSDRERDNVASMAGDAIDRHNRRHPKKESTIFNDIEFI